MTAQRLSSAPPRPVDDPLVTAADPLALARQHITEEALSDCPGGRVGLELEFHLVDLARPERRPTWQEATALAHSIGPLPSLSRVTLEPGGQIELSTPPADDVVSSVAALRADREVLRRPAARGRVRRRASGGRPRSPGRPDQPGSSLPRDGGALRRARLRRLGQGDDDGHRSAAGQPGRRAGQRLGGSAGADPVDGADAGGRLVDIALPRRDVVGLALDAPGHLAGDRPRAQRPGPVGRADRGVGDVRPERAGDARAARVWSSSPSRSGSRSPSGFAEARLSGAGRRWRISSTT